MLVITRRQGERIVIGDDVEVTIVAAGRRSVRVGIRAPLGTRVLRGEIHESIAEANRDAAASIVPREEREPAGGERALAGDTAVEVESLAKVLGKSRQRVVIDERHGCGDDEHREADRSLETSQARSPKRLRGGASQSRER